MRSTSQRALWDVSQRLHPLNVKRMPIQRSDMVCDNLNSKAKDLAMSNWALTVSTPANKIPFAGLYRYAGLNDEHTSIRNHAVSQMTSSCSLLSLVGSSLAWCREKYIGLIEPSAWNKWRDKMICSEIYLFWKCRRYQKLICADIPAKLLCSLEISIRPGWDVFQLWHCVKNAPGTAATITPARILFAIPMYGSFSGAMEIPQMSFKIASAAASGYMCQATSFSASHSTPAS